MKKLLEALDCPFLSVLPDKWESLLVRDQVVLICWLEDRIIRELDITARDGLRSTHSNCLENISAYLKSLGCPFNWFTKAALGTICVENLEALRWLAEHAVSLSFDDEFDTADEAMDVEHEVSDENKNSEVSERLDGLGVLIGLERVDRETNTDYLRRIIILLKQSLVKFQSDSSATMQLKDFPLGFDTGDSFVNEILLVLKMLYLTDFRELQDDVNDLIILCQEYTANPRLNPSLGKVGK